MSEQIEILRIEVAAEEYGVRRSALQSVQLGGRVRLTADPVDAQVGVLRTTEGELPVYRLSDTLGMDADFPVEMQRVLVMRHEGGLWCLLVDRVSQAEVIESEGITELPQIARAAYVDSVYAKGGDVLLLLDTAQLHPNAQRVGDSTENSTSTHPLPDVNLPAARPGERSHLLLFKMVGLNGRTDRLVIGLTPKQVGEVLRSADIQHVPAAAPYLYGVTSWRGRLIPVLDLAQRLGLNEERSEPARQDRLVIAHGSEGEPVAFYAKSGVDIVRLPAPHTPTDVPDGMDERLLFGAALYRGGRTVVVPKIGRLA